MTAQDVINFVRGIINSPTSGYITDAEIIGWINDGLKEFYSIEGIESVWKYPATVGDTQVTFDEDIIRVADMYIVDESGTKHDIPEADYKIFNNTVFFEKPTAYNGYYYVHAFKLPAEITETTDTIVIPKVFETAIKNYALAMAYLKDESHQLYQEQLSLFYNKVVKYKRFNRKVNERKYVKIERGF